MDKTVKNQSAKEELLDGGVTDERELLDILEQLPMDKKPLLLQHAINLLQEES